MHSASQDPISVGCQKTKCRCTAVLLPASLSVSDPPGASSALRALVGKAEVGTDLAVQGCDVLRGIGRDRGSDLVPAEPGPPAWGPLDTAFFFFFNCF